MKKKVMYLLGVSGLVFLSLFALDLSESSQLSPLGLASLVTVVNADPPLCSPTTSECGPLMGNQSGTRYCCANTDSSCCYAAGCGGGSQT